MAPRPPVHRQGPGGLVGIYALHLMTQGPIYGWQVAERISTVTREGWRPGAGAIYPILKGLVDRGFARTEVRDGTKLYRVTPRGRVRVRQAKARMREGAGRWVNLRLLVLDMIEPGARGEWALARLRNSLEAFTELARSPESVPRDAERMRLSQAGARELRRTLAALEARAPARASAGAARRMSSPVPTAIEVVNLSQRYGAFEALTGVNLAVRQGEIFGLLGPNGAGKTTLIKVLTGFVPPTVGDARVAGLDVKSDSREVKSHVGWVAAEVILDDDLTAMENLWMQAKLQHLGPEWRARATALLDYLGIADRSGWRVGKFSTGMRKKLEIALALLHRPIVIFMDEPTIGLDAATRRMFWELVQSVHREYGVTVLLTTHYIEEADVLCDRVAVIDHGKIIAVGTPSELKNRLGVDLIEIETAAPLDPGPLRAVRGVQEVRADGRRLTLKVGSAEEVLPRVLEAIPPESLRRINVERPNLETVFLELTGHRLGGEDAPVDSRKFYGQILRARR